MMTSRWRLIVDGAEPGVRNMSLDRALLDGRAAGTSPPTLRLYRWERPTLSLGRFQKATAVDFEQAALSGVDVVRRPTGGRAVLHDDEVTYAIVASIAEGVPRGVISSYRFFAAALTAAFRELGVDARATSASHGEPGVSACYLASNQADLVTGSSKLSGSAQVWNGEAVLQHGSFVVSRDVDLESRLLRLDADQARLLTDTTSTIEQATGVRPEIARIEEAITFAFESTLGIEFEPGAYSVCELAAARDLDQRLRVMEP